MRLHPIPFSNTFLLLLALLVSGQAGAQTTCEISSAPSEFSRVYTGAIVRVSLTVSVRCRTTSGTQAVSFTLTPNDGLNPLGTQNRAQFGSSFVNYDLYTSNSCATRWPGLSGTITATTTGVTSSFSVRHCITATTPAPSAGYHTDMQMLTLSVSTPGVLITGTNPWTYPVNIGVPLSCQVSKPPGDVDFGTYTAFSPTALTASTNFNVRCTQANRSLTLDMGANPHGVVPNTGLNYSLAINIAASGGSNPFNTTAHATANSVKTFYINGTMPAGQAGTCPSGTCAGSDTRTLTVTY